jgi:hypothetical protein
MELKRLPRAYPVSRLMQTSGGFTAVRTSADSAGTTPQRIELEIASFPLPNPHCFSLLRAVPCLGVGSPTPNANSCRCRFSEDPLFQYLAVVHALPLSEPNGLDEMERPRREGCGRKEYKLGARP